MVPNSKNYSFQMGGNGPTLQWTIGNHQKNHPLKNGPLFVANELADNNEEKDIIGENELPKLDDQQNLDALISDPICQRLFRIFLVFSGDNLIRHPADGRLLRFITRAQVQFLIGQIDLLRDQMQIGPNRPLPPIHSEEDAPFNFVLPHNNCCQIDEFANDKVTFRELLLHLLAFCPRAKFAPMVDRLFGRYVLQIVRKGFLLCRRVHSLPQLLRPFTSCLVPSKCSSSQRMASVHCRRGICRPSAGHWRPFWCVLTPGQLHLWPLNGKKEEKGTKWRRNMEMDPGDGGMMFDGERRRHMARRTLKLTKDSLLEMSDLERGGQLFGWLLATQNGLYEFAHFDQLQKQMWISDLEMVIRKRRPSLLLQFDRINSNQQNQQKRRSPSVGKQMLEKENRTLLERLEAERMALKDEECVRELATRMLDEEVQKGDELRQKVEKLTNELEAERRQRIQLENILYEQKWMNALEIDQNGGDVAIMNLSMPPERLMTPMPSVKKAKRMRDSLKRRKEGGGQELKVVNVVGMKKEEEEDEKKKTKEGKEMANLKAIYEGGGTLRATDLWDVQKCGIEQKYQSVEESPKLMMNAAIILSTQSV